MSRDPEATKRAILNATWTLLESADCTVRMSDIAKAAGVSRQAVYLHFPTRAELLIATVRHIDMEKDVNARLTASRSAATGRERLPAFVDAWCNYIPEVHGVATALMQLAPSDEAARAARDDRLAAIRHGCAAAVDALARDGALTPLHTPDDAADLLAALLSIPTYNALRLRAGWSQTHYVEKMQEAAAQLLIAN